MIKISWPGCLFENNILLKSPVAAAADVQRPHFFIIYHFNLLHIIDVESIPSCIFNTCFCYSGSQGIVSIASTIASAMKTTSHRNQQEIESFQDFFTYRPETYNRDYNTDRCTTNSIYGNDGFKNVVNHCRFSLKSPIGGEEDAFEDKDGCFIGNGNSHSSDEGYHDQYRGDENVSLQRNSSTCRRTGHNNDFNTMGSDNYLEYSINRSRRENSGISVTEDFKTAEVFERHDHDQGSVDDYDHGNIIDDGADFVDYSDSGRRHQFVCHGDGHIYRYDYLEDDVPQDLPKFHHQKPSRQGFSSEENEEACNSVFKDDGCQVTDIRDGYCGSFAIDDRNESQNEVIENLEFGDYDADFDEVKDCADANCQDDRLPLRLIGVPDLHHMDDYAEDDRQNLAHRRSPPCENAVDSTACEDDSSLSDEGEFAPAKHTSTRDDKQTDGLMSHRRHSDRTIQPIQNNRNIQAAKFLYSPLDVIQRIELVMASLIDYLDQNKAPILKSFVETRSDIIRANDGNDSDSELGSRACNRNINLRKNNVNSNPTFQRSFGNISQTRSFTSVVLVMSFVHQLLLSNRTTTTREVYYVFVTHFRSQRECDSAILDVAKILDVPRRALGLSASPKGMSTQIPKDNEFVNHALCIDQFVRRHYHKRIHLTLLIFPRRIVPGWFCGCVEITRKGTLPSGKDISGSVDGTAISSMQGLPITREWIERDDHGKADGGIEIHVSSKNAKCILVIEKEGVYNRLSEERLFDRFP